MFLIESSDPLNDPRCKTLLPFIGVTGLSTVTVHHHDREIQLDIILYHGEQIVTGDTSAIKGIAIASENMGIIYDRIASTLEYEIQKEIFETLSELTGQSVNALMEAVFDYADPERYRGQFD